MTLTSVSSSYEKLEAASLFCDEEIRSHLNHTPVSKDMDVIKFLALQNFYSDFYWKNGNFLDGRFSNILTENGLCDSFNAIDGDLVFRKKTVDPTFLSEYHFEFSEINPVAWSMKKGYSDQLKVYPLRVFDKDLKNGLKVYLKMEKNEFNNVNLICPANPMNYKIYFHHPAEVIPRNNFLVAFNKSATFFIKPKITRTSEELKSVDPSK